jgi:ABC-type nitrate/sulfonate/bicarbonate transport system permease component
LGLVAGKLLEVLLKHLMLAIVVGTWHESCQLLKHLLLIVREVVLGLGLGWVLGLMLGTIAVEKLRLGRLVELLVHLLKLLNASVAI